MAAGVLDGFQEAEGDDGEQRKKDGIQTAVLLLKKGYADKNSSLSPVINKQEREHRETGTRQ